MLSKTAGGIKTNYTYNAGNQLVGDGTYNYTYDKIGNLVEKAGNDGQVSYTYNALNLLEKWTDGENTETYTYNAAGLISQVTTNTSTSTLTWDILYGEGVVISSVKDGETTDYTYGLERISASSKNSRTEYVYDGRGSVIGEVSKSGLLSKSNVVTKSYTPFGEQIGEKTSGFGWNGEYYNATTGQVYLRARFYEPEMNRFSQKDILRGNIINGTSLNRYAYCVNDPINFVDINGMAAKKASTSGPVQNVNPQNIVQTTNQAKQDARRAADIANAVAPGSPQAQQATRAYEQTVQYSQVANATHNPQYAQMAVTSSKKAANYANAAISAGGKPVSNSTKANSQITTQAPAVQSPTASNTQCTGNKGISKLKSWFQNTD